MVSELKFYQRDPQPGMDRGRGWYYYRGVLMLKKDMSKRYNGRTNPYIRTRSGAIKKVRTWSKYSEPTDGKIPHLPKKIGPRSKVSDKEKLAPHKGDFKTRKAKASTPASRTVQVRDPRRPGRIVKRKQTRQGTGTRGFY